LKQGESELKAFGRLGRQDFACEADAQAALVRLSILFDGQFSG
jgi:hypothetical protein